MEEVWKTVRDDVRVEMTQTTFNSVIAPSRLTEFSEQDNRVIATIASTSPFLQKLMEERYRDLLQDAFGRVTGKPCTVSFSHDRIREQSTKTPDSFGPLFSHVDDERDRYVRAANLARLRTDFTFEQFAVSSTNEMAYAAAQAVTRNPGQAYHLLYLFGGVGVGKTHLMQAIGHRILEKDPGVKMLYKTGEEFTNEIVEAIRDKSTTEFHKRYRSFEVLLIDDIQFIGGKDKVQEEFFHTFKAIHQEGGQIVLTSDQMPSDIAGLEARLRSRFEGGLTIDIQQPSFELRAAILLIKAKAWRIEIPMDVAQLVAANIESTRQLEGFLKRLVAETTFKHEPVSPQVAERVLGSMKHHGEKNGVVKNSPEPTTILKTVSEVFSIKLSVIKGERRKKDVVTPRHLAMYLLRADAGLPLEEIGALFGGRDHTTVMHAVEKITSLLPNDERLRGSLAEVRKRIDATFPQHVDNAVD